MQVALARAGQSRAKSSWSPGPFELNVSLWSSRADHQAAKSEARPAKEALNGRIKALVPAATEK